MTFSSWGHLSVLVFSPLTTRATFTKCQSCTLPLGQIRLHFTTRANSMKRTEKRVCDGSPESMHGAAGAPPQLTDGACVAAQSTDVAALRHTLQARPLALRLHRERAIGAKSTDLCALHINKMDTSPGGPSQQPGPTPAALVLARSGGMPRVMVG